MANTATIPTEGQLLVEIEDMSLVKDIKRAIKMLKGVKSVRSSRRKRMTAYEESMLDVREGRINEYASVDDFFKTMGV